MLVVSVDQIVVEIEDRGIAQAAVGVVGAAGDARDRRVTGVGRDGLRRARRQAADAAINDPRVRDAVIAGSRRLAKGGRSGVVDVAIITHDIDPELTADDAVSQRRGGIGRPIGRVIRVERGTAGCNHTLIVGEVVQVRVTIGILAG